VAGEINVDLIMQGYRTFPELGREVLVEDSLLTLGSASAICAVGLARLGEQVAFAGKAGLDTWGDFCLAAMAARGVDVKRVMRRPDLKTGITVSITGPADRALVTHLGAIGALTPEDLPDSIFEGFHHLHVSSFFMQEKLRPGCAALFARARARGLTTSLDPGCDPAGRWGSDLLDAVREADLFFPNEVELRGATGVDDPVEALRNLENGRTLVVAKLGPHGAMALRSGVPVRVPAPRVQPVDTTGAGDSFNAGFLHGWLAGAPLEDALRFGAVCGALSTLGAGGTGSQPDCRRAEEFLQAWLKETK
jgi:sugar/nucleoside kinase (ribokinase family)